MKNKNNNNFSNQTEGIELNLQNLEQKTDSTFEKVYETEKNVQVTCILFITIENDEVSCFLIR